MKIKWLIILFIFFLGVVIVSLLITQQGQKAVFLSENKILMNKQAKDSFSPAYSSSVGSTPIALLPLRKSGITIIRGAPPVIESEEKTLQVSNGADKATNNIIGQDVAPSTQAIESLTAGITKIGKRPTSQKAREMNSSGIVMY